MNEKIFSPSLSFPFDSSVESLALNFDDEPNTANNKECILNKEIRDTKEKKTNNDEVTEMKRTMNSNIISYIPASIDIEMNSNHSFSDSLSITDFVAENEISFTNTKQNKHSLKINNTNHIFIAETPIKADETNLLFNQNVIQTFCIYFVLCVCVIRVFIFRTFCFCVFACVLLEYALHKSLDSMCHLRTHKKTAFYTKIWENTQNVRNSKYTENYDLLSFEIKEDNNNNNNKNKIEDIKNENENYISLPNNNINNSNKNMNSIKNKKKRKDSKMKPKLEIQLDSATDNDNNSDDCLYFNIVKHTFKNKNEQHEPRQRQHDEGQGNPHEHPARKIDLDAIGVLHESGEQRIGRGAHERHHSADRRAVGYAE